MERPVARRVVVRGRVQGVFFRDSTRRLAQQLGVVGWVRNTADGAVEAHVEGDSAGVAQLIEFMGQGPPHAVVSRVDVSEAVSEAPPSFTIR